MANVKKVKGSQQCRHFDSDGKQCHKQGAFYTCNEDGTAVRGATAISMCGVHKLKGQVHAANLRLQHKKSSGNPKRDPKNVPRVMISDLSVLVQLSEPFFRWTSDNDQERIQQLYTTDNVILVALLNAYGMTVTANRTKDFYVDQLTDCGALADDNSGLEVQQACIFTRQRQAIVDQNHLQSQFHQRMSQIQLRMDEDADNLAAAVAYAADSFDSVADIGHAAYASHEQMQDIATFVAAAEDQGNPIFQSTVAVVDGGFFKRSQELEAEVEDLFAAICS
jgi:hypothetical protein